MPTDHELAVQFAPVMNLHPDEKYFPMDPAEFVFNSRLCLARDNKQVAVFNISVKEWDRKPDPKSYFGVPLELLADWEALHGPEDSSWSRRPHDEKIAADKKQYALAHRTQKPTAPFDPSTPPPCFYYVQPWKDSTLISYWFFYGYSRFLSFITHQGDWEHATLRIRDNKVVSGFYAVHEDKYYVEAEDLDWHDGKLQVYSAKGRHATWWKQGNHMPGMTFFQKKEKIGNVRGATRAVLQDECARGPVWELTKNLQPLGDQPWRLFAGAWGNLGGEAHATGPLGPWFKRYLDPEEKVVME